MRFQRCRLLGDVPHQESLQRAEGGGPEDALLPHPHPGRPLLLPPRGGVLRGRPQPRERPGRYGGGRDQPRYVQGTRLGLQVRTGYEARPAGMYRV